MKKISNPLLHNNMRIRKVSLSQTLSSDISFSIGPTFDEGFEKKISHGCGSWEEINKNSTLNLLHLMYYLFLVLAPKL